MEDLTVLQRGTYAQFKAQTDRELNNQAEGFVRLGYLFKMARDTTILYESGYKTVTEFAQKEYGLSKDIVSRYIRINDRYSEGGCSDKLQEKYRGFGYSKLADMLTLPEAVVDSIPEEATRAQIQEVVRETRQEEKISDIEVALEQPDVQQEELSNNLERMLHQYFYEERWKYANLNNGLNAAAGQGKQEEKRTILELLAPNGYFIGTARISGTGKLMLTIKDQGSNISIVNVRGGEAEHYTLDDLLAAVHKLCMAGVAGEMAWETVYCEKFKQQSEPAAPAPQKEKVAPVQPAEKKPVQTEQPEAVSKTEESVTEPAESVSKAEEPEQIPGQDNIMYHQEYLPAGMEAEETKVAQDDRPSQIFEEMRTALQTLNEIFGQKNWAEIKKRADEISAGAEQMMKEAADAE